MLRAKFCLLASLAVGVPLYSLSAQSIRGTVVDPAGQPVSGVVVLLLDAMQTVVKRALTNGQGAYQLLGSIPGEYRLRTLRIGFQPTLSNPLLLNVGEVRNERLVLESVRVLLAPVRISERRICGSQALIGNDAVLVAWEQATASMAAATLLSASRGLTATTMQIERRLEPGSRRVRTQEISMHTDYVTEPWKALTADTLRNVGYVWVDATDSITYNAPGLEVLLSPHFREDHCLQLVAGRNVDEVGLKFEPIPSRRKRSEITGTLWLVRATAMLVRLEFTFTNTPGSTSSNAPVAR